MISLLEEINKHSFVAVGMALVLLSGCDIEMNRKPDFEEIKRYRINQLSDETIKKLYGEAAAEYEQAKTSANQQIEAYWKDRSAKEAERAKACSDIAYKTRNPKECETPPVPMGMASRMTDAPILGFESVDAVFDRKIMGLCSFVASVAEARKKGCLAS